MYISILACPQFIPRSIDDPLQKWMRPKSALKNHIENLNLFWISQVLKFDRFGNLSMTVSPCTRIKDKGFGESVTSVCPYIPVYIVINPAFCVDGFSSFNAGDRSINMGNRTLPFNSNIVNDKV